MWKVEPSFVPGLYNVYDEGGDRVVRHTTHERATLIASVLDLLAALERLYWLVTELANEDAFDNGVYAPDGRCEGDVIAAKIIERARAALAGAQGKGGEQP